MRTRASAAVAIFFCMSSVATAQVVPKAPPGRQAIIAAARDIIDKARFGSLVTLGEKGAPQARIVDPFAPDSSFIVWVATNPLTRKASQIRNDGRVILLWFDPADPGYVSLTGRATLVADPAEKARHWKEDWAGLYRDRNRGDDYLLIRIAPLHMEVVSSAHGMIGDPITWKPVMLDFPGGDS